jgi:hypothetical protein
VTLGEGCPSSSLSRPLVRVLAASSEVRSAPEKRMRVPSAMIANEKAPAQRATENRGFVRRWGW